MSDITRDDLRVKQNPDYDETFVTYHRIVTDEEFDRLAREAGYVKMLTIETFVKYATMHGQRPELLRALLTDECDDPECENGMVLYEGGHRELPEDWAEHQRCGGRGWLPKDGVIITDGCTLQGEPHSFGQCKPEYRLSVTFDWLETRR